MEAAAISAATEIALPPEDPPGIADALIDQPGDYRRDEQIKNGFQHLEQRSQDGFPAIALQALTQILQESPSREGWAQGHSLLLF
jgi:hypothetical protein